MRSLNCMLTTSALKGFAEPQKLQKTVDTVCIDRYESDSCGQKGGLAPFDLHVTTEFH